MKNQEYIFLVAKKIEQPIGSLYITSFPWDVLKRISYVDERILVGIEDDEEVYRGIQRNLSNERAEEIKTYVNKNPDATFPSSIIINIPFEFVDIISFKDDTHLSYQMPEESNFEFNYQDILPTLGSMIKEFNLMVIKNKPGVASIIDGQHRMSGFHKDSIVNFELPVTIFIDQIIEDQAETFAIINGKQTRVSPSLVYDLFGLSNKRNPYSVAHKITKSLNESENSPMHQWIRRLGKASEYYKGYLTQSTVVKNIISLMCGTLKQAEHDKIQLLKGDKLSLLPEKTNKIAPLRKYFVNEEDEIVLKILINFFSAIQRIFPSEWEKEDSIFKRTIGFVALTRVLSEKIVEGQKISDLSYEFFYHSMSRYKDLKFNDVQLSSKGINQIVKKFKPDIEIS